MVSMIRRWDVLGNDGAVAQPTWLPLPLFRAAQFYFNLRHVRVVHPFGAELLEASASLILLIQIFRCHRGGFNIQKAHGFTKSLLRA